MENTCKRSFKFWMCPMFFWVIFFAWFFYYFVHLFVWTIFACSSFTTSVVNYYCPMTCDLKVHLHWAKANFFLWCLSLLSVKIKWDSLWTHLEVMSVLLSRQHKRALAAFFFQICSRGFTQKASMLRHQVVHDPSLPRTYTPKKPRPQRGKFQLFYNIEHY